MKPSIRRCYECSDETRVIAHPDNGDFGDYCDECAAYVEVWIDDTPEEKLKDYKSPSHYINANQFEPEED